MLVLKVKEKLRRNWRKISLITVVIVLVVAASSIVTQLYLNQKEANLYERYNLLSRRMLQEWSGDAILNFRPLQNDYAEYLAARGLEDKVDIYFEYLPTGSTIGVNEDRQSTGASLLKLPLAVTFYKLVEEGRLSLDDTVALKSEWLNSSFGDLYKKGVGYELSYRDAIQYALRKSDNTAALALFEAVSKVENTDSPSILGFVDANYAQTPQKEVTISVQSYASILKCLYFSCYIDKDNSQAVLNELANSDAKYRLELYLPEDLKVAHKIGTFQNQNQSDCGIFYVQKRNYILCVMVQDKDPAASRVIADISQMTYKFVAPKEEVVQR